MSYSPFTDKGTMTQKSLNKLISKLASRGDRLEPRQVGPEPIILGMT